MDDSHFLRRIDTTGEHWLWRGGHANGVEPHVLAWECFIGSADGLQIRHDCGNDECVEPHHLAATWTPQPETPPRRSGWAKQAEHKLTEKDVRAILRDDRLYRVIAADYGVAVATIKGIRQRRKWRWVPAPEGYTMRPRGSANPLHPRHPLNR